MLDKPNEEAQNTNHYDGAPETTIQDPARTEQDIEILADGSQVILWYVNDEASGLGWYSSLVGDNVDTSTVYEMNKLGPFKTREDAILEAAKTL